MASIPASSSSAAGSRVHVPRCVPSCADTSLALPQTLDARVFPVTWKELWCGADQAFLALLPCDLGRPFLTSLPSSVKWGLCHQLSWDDNVESFGGKTTRGSWGPAVVKG